MRPELKHGDETALREDSSMPIVCIGDALHGGGKACPAGAGARGQQQVQEESGECQHLQSPVLPKVSRYKWRRSTM